MSVKKVSAASAASKRKRADTRAVATHPSWIDMIKECIVANTEDARLGVSRPHIKKYVEEQYRLRIGPAQNTQLSRAISTGAEKGIFVLPKGPAGRVKFPSKTAKPADTSASKENKPTKVPSKGPAKVKPASTVKKAKAATGPVAPTKSAVSKPKAVAKPAKPAAKAKAPVKTLASKKTSTAATKKVTSSSKRGSIKKVITGTSPRAKASATKKAPKKSARRTSSATAKTRK